MIINILKNTPGWNFLDATEALVGITEFAQAELGEIVYVDLPVVGK